jgi:predicted MFS family arabinose efflux permease
MVAGGILSGAAADYSIVFAGRLIGGIGAVLLNVLVSKMASDWFAGRELVTAMAILVSSFPLGIGLALAIEPQIASQFSWQMAFQAATAFALLGFFLVAAFYRPVTEASSSGSAASWGLAFTRDELILVSLAGAIWALLNVSYILLVSFAPTLLIERGLTAAQAGLATSVAGWTLLVSAPLGGMLIERSRRPLVAMAACTVATGAAIVLVATGEVSVAMIAAAGFITGLPAGAVMALPTQVLRPAQRSSGMGLYFTWYYLGMALLPPLAGKLRDMIGDPRVPLFVAAVLTIVTTACIAGFALKRASASPGAAR